MVNCVYLHYSSLLKFSLKYNRLLCGCIFVNTKREIESELVSMWRPKAGEFCNDSNDRLRVCQISRFYLIRPDFFY